MHHNATVLRDAVISWSPQQTSRLLQPCSNRAPLKDCPVQARQEPLFLPNVIPECFWCWKDKKRTELGEEPQLALQSIVHGTRIPYFCLASCLLRRWLKEVWTNRWKPGGVKVWPGGLKRPVIPRGPQGGGSFFFFFFLLWLKAPTQAQKLNGITYPLWRSSGYCSETYKIQWHTLAINPIFTCFSVVC